MRVTLFYPPRPGGEGTNLVPPIGLLYLGAVLEKAGHRVVLLDFALIGKSGKELVEDVVDSRPDVLMISAFTSDVFIMKPVMVALREALPGTKIWLGGPHASCVGAAAFLDFPQMDAVFLGEAEESVLEAILFPEEAPQGVVYSGSDPATVIPRQIEDLSVLPLPAWHLAPPSKYRGLPNGVVLKKLPYAPILTTRGCPYRCTFCAGFRVTGRRIRHRPLDQVWEEIDLLVSEYGVAEIHIEDDNFTFDRAYAKEFCRIAISRKLPVLFSTPNGVRLDALDDELLSLMREAGWYVVHCGIESGSDRILKKIKKATTTSSIKSSIDLIHSQGLPVAAYFILGIPGETEKEIQETIRFSRTSGVEWAQFACFLPIPGSPDGDSFLENTDMVSTGWEAFHNSACPAPPFPLSAERLKQLQRKAFLRFYLRPGQIFRTTRLLFHRDTFFRIIRRVFAYLSGRKGS
ncbi:MAG: B12-binding domain-containing radical SAM protein [Candidatus Fermentibacteraceae bacterium]|nr:B12-binding domain-containing radical SAM protein [Candidatus Fermentibacteraceae bacterium]